MSEDTPEEMSQRTSLLNGFITHKVISHQLISHISTHTQLISHHAFDTTHLLSHRGFSLRGRRSSQSILRSCCALVAAVALSPCGRCRLLIPLKSHYSSRTTAISHQSSYAFLHPSSHSAHHTALIPHHSSHSTHLTELISHQSSHAII